MPTEATKKQLERQDSTAGSKPAAGAPKAPQGTEDKRSPEEHYGGQREPHVQSGTPTSQQNPQGKQEPPAQPGQSRERGGSTEHSGQHSGGSVQQGSEDNPPPAQQGQHGHAGQKIEPHDDRKKDQRR
jgi:hypothetical protein